MNDPRDIVDIAGVPAAPPGERADDSNGRTPRSWLGVTFRCCSVYGRMYKDDAGLMYEGRCPRCRARVTARVGEGGTSRRFFQTH